MESDVGIEVYQTKTRGIGGRIKDAPEDFIVEEVPTLPPREDDGPYTVAWIRTRNWETNRLVRMMARGLRISRRRIRFAGTKDKRAITTRLFQFDAPTEVVKNLSIKDVEILEAYKTSKEIGIGDLKGNRFDVVIRESDFERGKLAEIVTTTAEELKVAGGFPNFFGMQRFGSIRPITHIVGRHIVKGDFKAAVDSYIANPLEGESRKEYEARVHLEESGDYSEALRTFPDVMTFEKAMLNHLVKDPEDYVGALRQLPFNLLMMFVHGYQSYLFNRMLSERIRRSLPINAPLEGDVLMPLDRDGLPDEKRFIEVMSTNLEKVRAQVANRHAVVTGVLFGSESVFAGGVMGEIEKSVIDAEKLKPEDFTIPKMPRLSSRGTRRGIVVPMPRLETSVSDGIVRLRFELPRGCYATAMLREFMKVDSLEG